MKSWKETFLEHGDKPAFIGGPDDSQVSFQELAKSTELLCKQMSEAGVGKSSVIGFPGIYSPRSLSMFFAIADTQATAVPLPNDAEERLGKLLWVGTDHGRVLGDEVPAEDLLREETEITQFEGPQDLSRDLGFVRNVLQTQAGGFAKPLQLLTKGLRVVGHPLHRCHHRRILSPFALLKLPDRAAIERPREPSSADPGVPECGAAP